MTTITFNCENTTLPELDYPLVREWIGEVAAEHDFQVGRISYLFCDDEFILRANREFIDHDYYTDIITFDYTRRDIIGGDIMISLDTVGSNAQLVATSFSNELLRVIIHGVLHLCGINDKGPGERENMEAHENRALEIWYQLNRNDARKADADKSN
ncbi:MAG: rRNA maturation RNase YbeY [Muribaculaceae bacterium]|nr:rRNA maturation RNase YbeY [Muribaculaceae bacterium]